MDSPAFILYDSRSGSTLFAALLNRAAGVSVSLESGFVSTVIRQPAPFVTPAAIDALVEALFAEIQFQELGLSRAKVLECLHALPRPASHRDVIEVLLEAYFGRTPSVARVVKHAPYFDMDDVLRVLPDATFLHLVRDGRAVYESKRRTRSVSGNAFMQANLIRAALDWRTKAEIASALGERALTLRYEDLIENQEATLSQVFDFLHVSEGGRVLTKSQEDYHQAIGERQRGLHTRAGEKPRSDLSVQWRHTLSRSDALIYELLVGDTLGKYGYPLVGGTGRWRTVLRPDVMVRLAYWLGHFGVYNLRKLGARLGRGDSLGALVRRRRRFTDMSNTLAARTRPAK
jgi:hypothetical protein